MTFIPQTGQIIQNRQPNPTDQGSPDHFGLAHLGKAFQAFEEYFIGLLLVSLIGYIIISAFGKMDFPEYILFLVIIFCIYGFSKLYKKISEKLKVLDLLGTFFVMQTLVLFVLLIVSNWESFKDFIQDILSKA